jgi:hypothetical protein
MKEASVVVVPKQINIIIIELSLKYKFYYFLKKNIKR